MSESLPHDLDAERGLLASVMIADRDVPEITARDFHREAHQLIFAAIERVKARGSWPDVVTVANELGQSLERAGGKAYILEVHGSEVTSTNVERYAEIVRELAVRRRLITAAGRIRVAAETGEMIDAHAEIEDAADTRGGDTRHVSLILKDRLATIGKRRPYVHLDGYPGVHLHFGDLALLAGRPGTGKSALALQIAAELAARHLKTKVYSLEMPAADWLDRLIMQRTPFQTSDLDDGLSGDRADLVKRSMAEVADWPLEVCDRNLGVGSLCADLRRFARRGGRVVIVDYLQLLVRAARGQSRYEAVTEASRQLKVAAMESGVLLIALSQLNRGSVGTDGRSRPPVLSDLRESGALEQDADDVLLLHRYDDNDAGIRSVLAGRGFLLEHEGELPLVSVHFAKLRRGRPDRLAAYFSGEDMTFAPLDKAVT
jgi:replicative DNA helicase